MGRHYTVCFDEKSGLWYAHMVGYSWIPVFGSFGTKQHATKFAADSMALTVLEYREYKQRYPKRFAA
jgi:hypothetical protein